MDSNSQSEDDMVLILPNDPLLHVMSFLNYKDIINCSYVCKRFHDLVDSDIIWMPLCKRQWDVRNCPENMSWKDIFCMWYDDYGRYIDIYQSIRKSWDTIEDSLEEDFPDVYESLQDGLSEEQLDAIEEKIKHRLPNDLRCSYRIHNGQKRNMAASGLFGSLQVYNSYTSINLMDLRDAAKKSMDMYSQYTMWQFTGSLVLSYCFHSSNMRLIALTNDHGYTPGQVYFPASDMNAFQFLGEDINSEEEIHKKENYICDDFIIANSFLELLTTFSKQLEDDVFSKLDDQMLMLVKDPKCVERTNSYFEVSVATCFYPEDSTINPPDFLHPYQVTLTMDENAPDSESCQLETRHWVVTDEDGKEQRVDGPGVVGEYPTLRPGSDYSWISCSTFKTTYGNMTGHFTMRNLRTGYKFDLKCPVFHMKCYSYQTSKDRKSKMLELKKDV